MSLVVGSSVVCCELCPASFVLPIVSTHTDGLGFSYYSSDTTELREHVAATHPAPEGEPATQ